MRSQELLNWIDNLSEDPQVQTQQIKAMPKALRKELLNEATLRNLKLKASLNDEENRLPENVREISVLAVYCKTPDIKKNFQELELDGWNDGNAPSSNIIDTSSLFAVLVPSRDGMRPRYYNETLLARQNTTILYTGEQLYQFDWDVFHALICLANGKFGCLNQIPPMKVLGLLGYSKAGKIYDQLAETLNRLNQATISIYRHYPDGKHPDLQIGNVGRSGKYRQVNLHLTDQYEWNRGLMIQYALDPRLSMLFANHEYGLIDWEKRNCMGKNELAKKLQCLFAGQKANEQCHRVAKVRDLSLMAKDMASFTRFLEKALNLLLDVGIIKAFWIEKPKRGDAEEKLFYIWKDKCPPEKFQNPGGRRGKYCDLNNRKTPKATKRS